MDTNGNVSEHARNLQKRIGQLKSCETAVEIGMELERIKTEFDMLIFGITLLESCLRGEEQKWNYFEKRLSGVMTVNQEWTAQGSPKDEDDGR